MSVCWWLVILAGLALALWAVVPRRGDGTLFVSGSKGSTGPDGPAGLTGLGD